MREAVDAIRGLDDRRAAPVRRDQRRADHRPVGRDGPPRRACERTAAAARDAGSLQLLDTALWIMSLAELNGGTPRRAAQYIEQVRELRRAIGYDAEHVDQRGAAGLAGRAPRRRSR